MRLPPTIITSRTFFCWMPRPRMSRARSPAEAVTDSRSPSSSWKLPSGIKTWLPRSTAHTSTFSLMTLCSSESRTPMRGLPGRRASSTISTRPLAKGVPLQKEGNCSSRKISRAVARSGFTIMFRPSSSFSKNSWL